MKLSHLFIFNAVVALAFGFGFVLMPGTMADIVGLIVSLMGTLAGTLNVMGWSAVLIYLVLVAGFTYFRFGKNA